MKIRVIKFSEKLLLGWTADLVNRLTYINDWLTKGPPKVFWIAGFYFPR